MRRRHLPRAVLVVLGTALAAATVALLADRPVGDVFAAVTVAAVGALASGALGAVLVRRCRGATARAQALVTALAPLVVLSTGVVAATADGRLDATDVVPLAVAAVAGTTVGVGAALELARGVGAAADRITGRLEAVEPGVAPPLAAGPRELAALDARVVLARRGLEDQRRRALARDVSRHALLAWIASDLRRPAVSRASADDGRLCALLADLVELAAPRGVAVQARPGRDGGGRDRTEAAPDAFDVAHRRPADGRGRDPVPQGARR